MKKCERKRREKMLHVILKGVVSIFVMCTLIGACKTTARAQNVREVEENNTKETAQSIEAYRQTPELFLKGDISREYVVNGSTSTTDEDWFKVYLFSGEQYVTCNDDRFRFQVYDSSDNMLLDQVYVKKASGPQAYSFVAEKSGYYYVKVIGVMNLSSDYILAVGGPSYGVAKCEIQYGTVSMLNGNDVVLKTADLRDNNEFPDDALVYTISMGGIGSSDIDSAVVENLSVQKLVSMNMYSWSKNNILSLGLPLKARWRVTLGYNLSDEKFNPSLVLRYVYPVKTGWLENSTIIDLS